MRLKSRTGSELVKKSIKQIIEGIFMPQENVFYNIQERETETPTVDFDQLMREINESLDAASAECNTPDSLDADLLAARALEFSTNYTVQGLGRIMEYYGLSKRRMKKDEIVQELVIFEDEMSNEEIVCRRRRLWDNLEELKEDSYLARYVTF